MYLVLCLYIVQCLLSSAIRNAQLKIGMNVYELRISCEIDDIPSRKNLTMGAK